MRKYIVASGDGFFRQFIENTPEMVSDPVCGTRMGKKEADIIKDKINKLGFEAYLVPVREGKITNQIPKES